MFSHWYAWAVHVLWGEGYGVFSAYCSVNGDCHVTAVLSCTLAYACRPLTPYSSQGGSKP